MKPSESITTYLIDKDIRDSLRKDGLDDKYKLKRWCRECCKLFTQHDTRLIQLLEIFNETKNAPRLSRSSHVIIRYKQATYTISCQVAEEIRSSVESPLATYDACSSLKTQDMQADQFYALRGNLILCCISLSAATNYEHDGLEDMRLLFDDIYRGTLARLKTLLIDLTRSKGVRDPLESFNDYSIIGMFIRLDLKETLQFAPIQQSLLEAMYEPFSADQMRSNSKWFMMNVLTFGVFTKWFLGQPAKVTPGRKPHENMLEDITRLDMEIAEPKEAKSKPKRAEYNPFECFLFFNSTRRLKLLEKAIFDFELCIVLVCQSLLGQNYKHEALDTYVLVILSMMVLRIFRFITCR